MEGMGREHLVPFLFWGGTDRTEGARAACRGLATATASLQIAIYIVIQGEV